MSSSCLCGPQASFTSGYASRDHSYIGAGPSLGSRAPLANQGAEKTYVSPSDPHLLRKYYKREKEGKKCLGKSTESGEKLDPLPIHIMAACMAKTFEVLPRASRTSFPPPPVRPSRPPSGPQQSPHSGKYGGPYVQSSQNPMLENS